MQKDEENAFELTEDGDIKLPDMNNSDYLEMGVLTIVFILGVPLNGMVLYRLLNMYTGAKAVMRQKQEDAKLGYLMLKIHLTIIDLILIILYCPAKFTWLLSYEWLFGALLCKTVQYAWMFAHHLMSFGVVCIALDRVKTVCDLMAMRKKGRMPSGRLKIICVKRLIALSYIGAAVFSLPQWFVWTTVDLTHFSQCTTIWHKQRANDFIHYGNYSYYSLWEQVYVVAHLTTVFWGPFLILVFSYACIIYSLFPQASGVSKPALSLRETSSFEENSTISIKGSGRHSRKRSSTVVSLNARTTTPAWRLGMRSRMCHTSVQIILAYWFCWLPYNIIALAIFVDDRLNVHLSVHADILRVFALFNSFLNPFIYGFRDTS